MLTRAIPPVILSALALVACSHAPALWPHVGARAGECPPTRREEIQRVLRSLTLSDFSNWRAECNCASRTLRQALYGTQDSSAYSRHAIFVRLNSPIYAATQGFPGNSPDQRPISSLVIVREIGTHAKDSTVYFGRPKAPRLRIASAVAYDGWGLNGDPFGLKRVEC